MRTWGFSVAIVVSVHLCMGLAPIGQAQPPDADSPPVKRVKKIYTRRVDFKITNPRDPEELRAHVVGTGEFPLRMEIIDDGDLPRERQLQVFVTIYVGSGEHKDKAKKKFLVSTQRDPRILKTAAGKNGKFAFDLDTPLLPGDYVAHIFVCDPTAPFDPEVMHHPTFPDPGEFPGAVLRGKALTVHVD